MTSARTITSSPDEARLPARCAGCAAASEPRPLGQTPEGWQREAHGQGCYWCPDCVALGRPQERA